MTRIPVLDRDDMDAEQQAVHDRIVANNARVGFGPAIGYAYSAGVWQIHNMSSAHLLDCSLTSATSDLKSANPDLNKRLGESEKGESDQRSNLKIASGKWLRWHHWSDPRRGLHASTAPERFGAVTR